MLRFLKSKSDQISGFKGCDDAGGDEGGAGGTAIYEDFCARLREFDAGLLESALDGVADPIHHDIELNGANGKVIAQKSTDIRHTNGHALPTSFELDLEAEELAEVPW